MMMPQKTYDRIHVIAVLHTGGQFQSKVPVDPRFDQECSWIGSKLKTLKQAYFQFSPLSDACWVAICATTDNQFPDDPRPGTLPFAFLFSRAQAEILLNEPYRLFQLRKYMENLSQEKVEELLEKGLDCWPTNVMIAPQQPLEHTGAGAEALQVMMEDLYGEPCYSFCEGENELLAMLEILPPKLRLFFSFATSYIWDFSDMKIQFYTSGPPQRLTDGPTRKRYDIGDGLPAPKVSPQAAKLAELIQELRSRNLLDEMDKEARDQKNLKEQLQCLAQMRTYLKNGEGNAARKLLKQEGGTVSGLVRWLTPEEQEAWAQLTNGKEVLRDAAARAPVVALMAIAAAMLVYIPFGGFAELNHLYFTIQFTGLEALSIALSLILGLCTGYLLGGGNEK